MVGQIDFSALQTPDIPGNALKYYRAGQQQTGQEQGGAALGAGDYSGAAAAYGRAGMSDDAANALHMGATQQQQQLAAQRQKAAALLQVAEGLQRVPEGQRKAALQSAGPLLQAAQIDPSVFDHLSEEQLNNQALRALGAKAQTQLEVVNRGNGGYDVVDKDTGDAVRTVDPVRAPKEPPAGYRWGVDGSLQFIPGGPGDPKVIGTRAGAQRDAIVARPMPSRAKPGEPAIVAPAAPWQRKW